MEQTEGDADMAREMAQSMLDDKVTELEEAQKQQPKEGKSVAEKIAARKEHKANIERIEKEIEQWQQIRQWFGDMLSRAKIKLNFSISDNELRYLLWRSHELSRMNGREGVVVVLVIWLCRIGLVLAMVFVRVVRVLLTLMMVIWRLCLGMRIVLWIMSVL